MLLLIFYTLVWVQNSCQAPKLMPDHPLAKIYTLQKARSKFDIFRYHSVSFEVHQRAGPRTLALNPLGLTSWAARAAWSA